MALRLSQKEVLTQAATLLKNQSGILTNQNQASPLSHLLGVNSQGPVTLSIRLTGVCASSGYHVSSLQISK